MKGTRINLVKDEAVQKEILDSQTKPFQVLEEPKISRENSERKASPLRRRMSSMNYDTANDYFDLQDQLEGTHPG